jgi:Putative heavy-metal-binding
MVRRLTWRTDCPPRGGTSTPVPCWGAVPQHEPWNCTWCRAPNSGYTRRNDPATATVADLAVDMVSHGLEFAGQRQAEQVRDTQPVLIVTTNEIPGYRITQVHGDVFGPIVRARHYFSNLGAQFRTLAGGEVAGYTKLLADSRNQARERLWREARMRAPTLWSRCGLTATRSAASCPRSPPTAPR